MNLPRTLRFRLASTLAHWDSRFVLRKIEQHRAILHHIRARLPEPLAEHCKDCAVVGQGRLLLFTDSPAWAFQLRFHGPTLLEKLSEIPDCGFRHIEIRVLAMAESSRQPVPMPVVSPETAQRVRECAAGNASTELGAALARLASTLETANGKRPRRERDDRDLGPLVDGRRRS